jgi:hypothetical protein
MAHLLTATAKGAPLTPAQADGNLNLLETRTGDGWFDNVSQLYLRDTEFSADPAPFVGGISLRRFIPGEMREAFVEFHIPHTWKPGTMMYPHVHFTILSSAAGTVRWGFEYIFARTQRSDAFTQYPATTTTLYIEQVISSNSERTHFVVESPEGQGIPGTNLEVDGMILARIFRDGGHANDTFNDDVFGITVDLHTEIDRYSTLFRFPPFYTAPE